MLLTVNAHGQVIQDLLRGDRPITPALLAASELEDGELRDIVKFFINTCVYEFVTAEHIAENVFVHSRVLNDCGVHSLMQSQKLLIKVDDAGKGPKEQAVRLLNE